MNRYRLDYLKATCLMPKSSWPRVTQINLQSFVEITRMGQVVKICMTKINSCFVCLPGLQSVKREHTESKTFETVNAGLQLSFRISKQITPWLLMLQW